MDAVTRVASALLALVALGAPALARADITPAPCVASGVVAIVQPSAAAAVTLGPAVSAATKQGTPTASFHDAQYVVDLTNAVAGAAGCVGASAPGGTHAATGAWSVLGGALRGSALTADLVPAGGDGSGWHLRTNVAGLEVAGAATDPVPGATVAVADWGTLSIAAQADLPRLAPLRHWAAALSLRLLKPHAGLPAGTLVLVGYAAANRAPAPPPAPVKPPATTTAPITTSAPTTTAQATTTAPAAAAPKPKPKPKQAKPKPEPRKPKPRTHARAHRHPRRRKLGQPLTVLPPLQVSGDVFPVAGGADWGDTYGGERSDVPGGWHHGDDLFAPLGTPVVAVASGTVFAVGWNEVGGWRLWLRDAAGNSFYYAHLSGYTRLARDNRHVERGDVLGFVGNTGDAFTTEPHLHFEVHPNATLYLGYDGAVDPTSYLRSWPLPRGVHVLPPVRLPGIAPTGFGSVTDFRKLLAVHPMPVPRRPAKKRDDDEKQAAAPARPARRSALGGARAARAAGGGDGALPVVFAIVLLACGLGAVAHTARVGRT
jgi:murein DD-endopeptidase MepM/ murein hydrolase activator NlpD